MASNDHATQLSPAERKSRMSGKFARMPKWVLSAQVLPYLKYAEFKVLAYLCDTMDNDTNQTWVTRRRIAEHTGVYVGSLSCITRELAICGILTKNDRGGRCEYTINFIPPEWWCNGGSLQARNKAGAKIQRREIAKQNFSSVSTAEVIRDEDITALPN